MVALCTAICLTGWIFYTVRYEILSPADLRVLVGNKPALAKIRGTLLEPATTRVYTEEGRVAESTLAHVRVSTIQLKGVWRAAFGEIIISTPALLPPIFFTGQEVVVDGVLKEPPHAQAEGLFDYRYYLRLQRIFYQLSADSATSWSLAGPANAPLPIVDRFQRWASNKLSAGLPPEDETVQMLWSMTLGTRTSGNPELSQPFMRTGTLHIFAISGLHVACIAAVLVFLLRLLGVPRHIGAWVVLPLIWFYTGATGWQSSAIRSAIMSSLVILGWAIKRPTHLLNSLAAAALIILIWQPEQLFQASFQLSFVVVLSIVLFMPALETLIARPFAPDPFLPSELRPGWRRSLDSPITFLTSNFAISVAAFFGALPVVAYYFNLVTPNSLVANLVAVPLSSLSLASSLGALLFPWPFAFNFLSWAFMDDLSHFTRWLAGIPYGFIYVPKPTFAFFILYYALVLLIMVAAFRQKAAFRNALLTIAAIGGIWWAREIISAERETTITMLPVRGTPVLVDAPGSAKDLLIDCSGKRDADRVVTRFLRAQGFNSIQHLLLSHGDATHIQGFEIVDREFSPRQIITSAVPFRSTIYKRLLKQLREFSPQRLREVLRGDSIDPWQVLHPDRLEKLTRADDKSLVLFGTIEGLRVLILSDLGGHGQKSLLRAYPDLEADIVITGLPEIDEPLGPELLEKLRPKLIAIGTTKYPARAQGSRELRERLARLEIPVLYASDGGAITLRFSKRLCRITDMEEHSYIVSPKKEARFSEPSG
jgi:competence protein ComEC